MLKLHGFGASNYVNMVKLALLEKGTEFEFVVDYPTQEEDFLAINPIGKVPVLETEHGFLSETAMILEYIDRVSDGPALFPSEPFANAHLKQIMHMIELYIELPARRCYAEVFFGGSVSDETKEQVKAALIKGSRALARITDFSPYVAGDSFSAADAMFLYSFDLASAVARKLFDLDLRAEAPGAADLIDRLNQRDTAKQVAAERDAAMEKFLKYARGGK
ncbi:glutathione S-transferase [Alcanivorax sp. N3-2A]|nr:glutathione S-transferase [Alcanivorax sp. N3-2A]